MVDLPCLLSVLRVELHLEQLVGGSGPGPLTEKQRLAQTEKADYYLRLANRFAQERRGKTAIKYARKVIDLMPDSEQARKAQVIIDNF